MNDKATTKIRVEISKKILVEEPNYYQSCEMILKKEMEDFITIKGFLVKFEENDLFLKPTIIPKQSEKNI